MLYIHKLSDLNIKSAEIESVQLVRDIRQAATLPFTIQGAEACFSAAVVSENEIRLIERSLQLLEPALAAVNALLARNDALYEAVNLHRTVQSLAPLSKYLGNNLAYAREMLAFQNDFLHRAVFLVNAIPRLRTAEEKAQANSEIGSCFECILRSKEFAFNFWDIVHEAQTILIHDLAASVKNGYFFHVTLEEEIRKATFADIQKRIPAGKLSEVAEIERMIAQIGEGIEAAYSLNMRMVGWAVQFLACIKWAMSG